MIKNRLITLVVALSALTAVMFGGSGRSESSRVPPTPEGREGSPPAAVSLSDGQFVFGPNVESFDLQVYLQENAPHLLPEYDSLIFWSAYPSLNPRVVLTLIEMRTGLVTDPAARPEPYEDLFGITPLGVNAQLETVAGFLTDGYYQHLRQVTPLPPESRPALEVPLKDGGVFTLAPETNAATYGIAGALAAMGETEGLSTALDRDQPAGFFQTYRRLFPDSDPLDESNRINIQTPPPADLLQLPYLIQEAWTFNGVHNWSGLSGSDMSSLDFSEDWPDWGIDTSNVWVVAAAPGTVLRYADCWLRVTHSDGWTTSYYHLEDPIVSTGQYVGYNQALANVANTLSEAICYGGSSTGPHLHYSLLRNGAYVPLEGGVLSGWTVNACSYPYDYDPACMYLEQDGIREYAYDVDNPLENQGVDDTIPPSVTVVSSRADTGDNLLGEGESTFAAITQLTATFREFVYDPAGDSDPHDVTNPANYRLFGDGGDNVFQTAGCGSVQGDDRQVAIDSVSYLYSTQTATVNVNGGSPLPADGYRLVVCGAIHDLNGNTLDGDGDGAGGGDFSRSFVITLGSNFLPLPPNSLYGQPDFASSGANNGGRDSGSLYDPAGLTVDSSGGVYVADSSNHRVLYYPPGSADATRVYGQPDFTSGTPNNGGLDAGSLSHPLDVAVDSTGVYVADAENNRVLFYPGTSTTATRVYGQPDFTSNTPNNGGISATSLLYPTGAAVGGGGVYVVDYLNNRVLYYAGTSTTASRVYGQQGSFNTNTYNKGGISADSLGYPSDIGADSAGVYVADADNDRVLFYAGSSTTASRVYGQPDFTSGVANNGGISPSSLNFPLDVTADGIGGLYVADSSNHRVLFYSGSNTTALRVYGQADFASSIINSGGVNALSLYLPLGVAADGDGHVYITDNGNHRMLGYRLLFARLVIVHR